jgi:hypothetical protein
MPTASLRSRTRGKIPSSTSSSANKGSSSSSSARKGSSSGSKLVSHLAMARMARRSAAESGLANRRRIITITPILPPPPLFRCRLLLLSRQSDYLSCTSRATTPLLPKARANSRASSGLWISFRRWACLSQLRLVFFVFLCVFVFFCTSAYCHSATHMVVPWMPHGCHAEATQLSCSAHSASFASRITRYLAIRSFGRSLPHCTLPIKVM